MPRRTETATTVPSVTRAILWRLALRVLCAGGRQFLSWSDAAMCSCLCPHSDAVLQANWLDNRSTYRTFTSNADDAGALRSLKSWQFCLTHKEVFRLLGLQQFSEHSQERALATFDASGINHLEITPPVISTVMLRALVGKVLQGRWRLQLTHT